MTFQSKLWLYNQFFQVYPLTKRTDSYWTHANNYIAMKIRILNVSFQILEGSGRGKKINVLFLFTKV